MIRAGTHEQDCATAEITSGVERMHQLGQDVLASSQEQTRESRQIAAAVEVVASGVKEIYEASAEQSKQGEQIVHALQVFREITHLSSSRARETRTIVETLASRSGRLEEEVDRFSL